MSTTIEKIIENRQLSHLTTLDSAYIDAYTNLRQTTGEDLRLPHLLADSYNNYQLWRKSLIQTKLDQVELNKRNSNTYPTNNRFLLPQCGNLQTNVQQSMVTSLNVGPSSEQSLSYPAWRRLLLARKFEKRRGLVEEESIRRRAAEAVQRAMEAEAAAREEYEEIREERERNAHLQLENNNNGNGNNNSSSAEQEIWRIKHHLSAYDEINDPAVMQAILALGIGASNTNKHSNNNNTRKRANSAVARSLFGDAVDRYGARSVTALSFLPENPDIFAAATDVGIVYLCSAQHGLIWATLTGHEGSVTAVDWAVSEGNIFLVTTSIDKTARVWYITLPVIEVPEIPTESSATTTSTTDNTKSSFSTAKLPNSSSSSLRSRSTSKERAKDPLIREAERNKAKQQMEKEQEKRRLEEWKARGPVAHGGTAQVVQVIVTDCPLMAVSFFPLNPSLFVAAAIEESDYNSLLEAQVVAAAITTNPSHTNIDISTVVPSNDGSSTVTGGESSYKGYGPEETDNAAAQQMKQVGKALENVFKKGFDVALKGVAKTAQAVVQVGSILPGVALLAKRRARARGYVLVMDAVSGEVIQRRLIQGDQVNPTTLQRPISYPTALTFSLDGTELYVADGRGLVHQYDVETDDQKISNNIASPLGNHTVLYGESSALISGLKKLGGHMKAAIVEGGTGLMDNNSLANIGLPTTTGTTTGGSNENIDPTITEETPVVYFTSLYFKRDFALDAPVLVGLDSTNRVRALSVPNTSGPLGLGQLSQLAAPDDDVAKAALAAVGATTKATAFLLKTTVGVATLGAVQMNTQPQSTELANYIQYSQYYNTPIGAGDIFNSLSSGHNNNSSSSSTSGSIILPTGGIAATSQAHIMLAPVYSDDTILTGNATGDIFVLHPHGTGTDTATVKKRGRTGSYLNLAVGSTSGHHHTSNNSSSASIGSGVSAVQVESKLSGHNKPLSAMAIAPRERFLASADISGNIIVWEKIPVSQLMQEYETKKQKELEEEETRRRNLHRGRKSDGGTRSSNIGTRNRSAPPK